MQRSKEEWTELFAKTGVADPEQWAAAEAEESLGNLPRVAFLAQAWSEIPRTADGSWVEEWISHARRNRAEKKIVEVFEGLMARGASSSDLATIFRGVMGHFLRRVCYLLDDSSLEDEDLREAAKWGVYEESDVEVPIRRLGCIHELVFSVDPEAKAN